MAILGNAGGTTARALGRFYPDAHVDGVELDPAVSRAGREWFGMDDNPKLKVHDADARPFLRRLDPEEAHRLAVKALRLAPLPRPAADNPKLQARAFGLEFPNPLPPGWVPMGRLDAAAAGLAEPGEAGRPTAEKGAAPARTAEISHSAIAPVSSRPTPNGWVWPRA